MAKIKTSWDLSLLYKNENDPQIEKDARAIESANRAFAKKYRGANFTSSPAKLAKALSDFEKVAKISNGAKPWWYFALRNKLNSDDAKAGAMATKLGQRLTEAGNLLTFFSLEIGKIPKSKQTSFLGSKLLAPYAYKLKLTFDNAKYNLSEPEEQIIDLLSQTSYTMWVDGNNKLLNSQPVTLNDQSMPISELMMKLEDFPDALRQAWSQALNNKLKEISPFAEAEINAVYSYKKLLDERRGLKKPYTDTVLGYENTEKEIEALVGTITKYFSVSQRFYRLHAKLLGKKKLSYADRSAKIGEIKKKFLFEDGLNITRRALGSVDLKYATILDSFMKNGQIDVYPKKGKSGGAFCWGQGTNPTFVLLNQVDTTGSIETLGHEMGHAIHTELSKTQPPHYQNYSTATAETASTFFELVTLGELEKELSDDERIIFLHNKIRGDISTIFRQIACFNFELELHQKVRAEGQVSRQEIAKLLAKHMQSYIGDAAEVTEDDGYTFVSWGHIRRFFYVYSYAYGQLISRALYEKWKEDPAYAKKIEQFLKAGKSMSPKDIFKSIGINTSDPKFFAAGLKGIEKDIERLEKLTQNLAKNK